MITSKLRTWGKRFALLVIMLLISSCTKSQPYSDKERKVLESNSGVQIGSERVVRNNHNIKNLSINNVPAKSQPYIGKERNELESNSVVQMGSGGTVRNGYSVENLSINGVFYVATFKLVGDQWQNQDDILVVLESVTDFLK